MFNIRVTSIVLVSRMLSYLVVNNFTFFNLFFELGKPTYALLILFYGWVPVDTLNK